MLERCHGAAPEKKENGWHNGLCQLVDSFAVCSVQKLTVTHANLQKPNPGIVRQSDDGMTVAFDKIILNIMFICELPIQAVQSLTIEQMAGTEKLCERLHKCFYLTIKLHWEAVMQQKNNGPSL